MVVGLITTHEVSAYHHYRCEFKSLSGKVYSMLQFHPPIKLDKGVRVRMFNDTLNNISALSWRSDR
jgi:hypothetical protein